MTDKTRNLLTVVISVVSVAADIAIKLHNSKLLKEKWGLSKKAKRNIEVQVEDVEDVECK